MKELAKKAGISRTAVSMILNDKEIAVKDSTREKIKKLALEFNYQPNHYAQSLKTGKTNCIGITTTGMKSWVFNHSYSALVYEGISLGFAENQYQLTFQRFNNLNVPVYKDLVERRSVDGLIFLLYSRDLDLFKEETAHDLEKARMPYVVIHSTTDQIGNYSIGLDSTLGGMRATEHLIEHGYGKIGCVRLSRAIKHTTNLYEGYTAALNKHGIEVNKELIFEAERTASSFGSKLAEKMIQDGKLPEALFVVDDDLALEMMKKFNEAGIKVPEDIALIGFGNDDRKVVEYADLTTVIQPAINKGVKAGELLLQQIEHPENFEKVNHFVFSPELAIRKSCGCNNNNKIS